MKKTARNILCALLTMLVCLCASACTQTKKDLWEDATYTQDTVLGDGEKTLKVQVEAEGRNVTFTIKTDKETVGEALSEHKLIEGENGAYGIYINVVNGICAKYSENQSYWSFYKDGEYMSTGVDTTKFEDNEHYELVYTK